MRWPFYLLLQLLALPGRFQLLLCEGFQGLADACLLPDLSDCSGCGVEQCCDLTQLRLTSQFHRFLCHRIVDNENTVRLTVSA